MQDKTGQGTTSRLSTQRPTANFISATKRDPHAKIVANDLLVAIMAHLPRTCG